MQAPHLPEAENAPAPLEFFHLDAIHKDNRSLLDQAQQRWRLLSWWERLKLQGYVTRLARQLRRGRYNQRLVELHKLRSEFRRAKAQYQTTTYISDQARHEAYAQLVTMSQRAKILLAALKELKPIYANYSHYAGWLEYEQQHRHELKAEAKREQRIRKAMRKEASWLQALLIDVFRKTQGCHHIEHDDGKERTRTPKFERSVILPDAHYFYLSASRRTLLGWRWKLPYGVTITRLTEEDVIANMRAATKRQVDAVWSETGQLMFRVSRLDSPDALPKEVKWRDAMRFFPNVKRDKLPYTIGVSESRKFQWFDLDSDPHILVAGKSQSGKSNLVNGIIGTLASTHSPDELRMVLIDQKGGIEFTHWYELPHLLWDIVKTVDEVKPVLIRLVDVMRKRMALLERAKAKKIAEYNLKVDAEYRLARVMVVIDEMNTFVGLGKRTEEIHNMIALLVSQGRAVGLHVITATQHPEVKVIPGRIKTNMSMRLSGAMPSVVASMIILDNPEAARLPNIPGRFAAVVGLKSLTVQVPHILDEDIAGVVSSTRKQYPDVSENLSEMKEQPKLVVWNEQRVLALSLDLFEGQISADRLHETLGGDSPGEREMRRLCRRIRDIVDATGEIEREDDHTVWKIKRVKRAYMLVPKSEKPDVVPVREIEPATTEKPSAIEAPAISGEPAAD